MELKIEYLPVSALTPYEKNTRKHEQKDIDNIAESIRRYGMNDAVGIWGDKNIIVEGHGRVLACKKLGIDTVPCVRLDHLTDEQRREYAIVHNATAELSIWDKGFLAEELESLDLSDFDFKFDIESKEKEDGEVEFSEEMLLTHNYIVLYFDNDFDWEVAQDKFGLKKVKDLIPRKGQPTGIGRVINGKEVLKWQN